MRGSDVMRLWVGAALVACGEGPGANTAGEPPGEEGTTTAGVEVEAASATEWVSPESGEIVDAEAVAFQIFDQVVEPEGPRRVTLHMLVSTEGDRDQLRTTLSEVIMVEVDRDSVAVAIRAVGYRPRQIGPDQADMEPYIWAEWLPPEGWYEAHAASREGVHRLYFYHPVAPQW